MIEEIIKISIQEFLGKAISDDLLDQIRYKIKEDLDREFNLRNIDERPSEIKIEPSKYQDRIIISIKPKYLENYIDFT